MEGNLELEIAKVKEIVDLNIVILHSKYISSHEVESLHLHGKERRKIRKLKDRKLEKRDYANRQKLERLKREFLCSGGA